MDAITMLSNDHSKFRQMLGQLATKGFGNTDKKEPIARIEREVKVHSKLEEDIFYPASKDARRAKMAGRCFSRPWKNTTWSTRSCPS